MPNWSIAAAAVDRRRRRVVTAMNDWVADRYPGFLRLWRRPVVRVSLILAALLAVMLIQPRTHLEWKLSHALWDYEFGFIKRGLVGEVFAWFDAPVTIDRFFWAFGAIYVLLAAIVAAAVSALPRSTSPVILAYLCLTPMLLRNVFYDWARFDVFGLIAVWLMALMVIRRLPGRGWLYALAPLTAFAHEANLMVVVPFAAMLILVFEPPGWWSRVAPGLALCGMAGASALLIQANGGLDVAPEVMVAHMEGKTTDRFERPLHVLTASVTDSIAERASFILGKLVSFKFALKLAIVLVLFRWLLPPCLLHGRVALALLIIAVGFLPLYVAGTDSFRWLALQANVAFAFVVVAIARLDLRRLRRDRIYLVAASAAVPALGI